MPSTYLRTVTSKFGDTNFEYLFHSRLDPNRHDDFGQKAVTASTNVTNLVMGCNNFKPYRASILVAYNIGYEGSFCSDDKAKSLRGSGYTITRKKNRIYNSSLITETYFVEYNGVCIAWIRRKPPSEINLKEINVKVASAYSTLIFGASWPRPAVVTKRLSNGSIFQTFCGREALSSSGQLTKSVRESGWKLLREALYTDAQFKSKFSISRWGRAAIYDGPKMHGGLEKNNR